MPRVSGKIIRLPSFTFSQLLHRDDHTTSVTPFWEMLLTVRNVILRSITLPLPRVFTCFNFITSHNTYLKFSFCFLSVLTFRPLVSVPFSDVIYSQPLLSLS